jgi:hypothetical protein
MELVSLEGLFSHPRGQPDWQLHCFRAESESRERLDWEFADEQSGLSAFRQHTCAAE